MYLFLQQSEVEPTHTVMQCSLRCNCYCGTNFSHSCGFQAAYIHKYWLKHQAIIRLYESPLKNGCTISFHMLTLCCVLCLCTGSAAGFSGTTGWPPRCSSPRSLPSASCGSSPTTCTCRPSGRSTQQTPRRSSVVTRPSSSCSPGLCSEIASWASGWVRLCVHSQFFVACGFLQRKQMEVLYF